MKTQKMSTQTLVLTAVLTAMVIVLQFMGAFVKFGPFSISLVLVPIVIGAATCGYKTGAWLGFIFGAVVLISGDAAAFMAVNPFGTVVTVLAKGTLCGLLSGIVYELLRKFNSILAVIAAAVVCPLVNTGIFLLGCLAFFMPTITEWAGSEAVGHYMIFVLVGANFLVELAVNIVLSPIIVRLINIRNK
ncbi:MAG: ECF transporter S component [Clostridia bacterium]|nr:ECF transporter S component [Clostridia bacterium]